MSISRRILALALMPILITILTRTAFALTENKKIPFTYHHADLVDVIEAYAKASHETFVINPEVRGKITILNPGSITLEEAFKQLSVAMAANNLGISKKGNVSHVMLARSLQRDLIPMSTELPAAEPERMVTWIYHAKYVSVDEINKQLRILTSKDGELVPFQQQNALIMSDWSTNVQRISEILKEIDKPAATGAKK